MKSEDVLLNAWEETVARKPEAAAIIEPAGEVARTFGDIERESRELEREILDFGPGSVIAIEIGNRPQWPALFLGCLRRQIAVLPLDSGMAETERKAALEVCQAAAVVSAVPCGDKPEVFPLATAPKAAGTGADVGVAWDGDVPSLLKLTSGTTGKPRAIRFQSAQLLADCQNICGTMRITEHDLNFGVIPISHSYGFSNLLTPLIARGIPMVLSVDRLPRAILLEITRTKATVFPGTPLFYQSFCEMEDVPALPSLRLCISAGAPLGIAMATRFREKFNLAIHSFYGASECGGICYDRDGAAEEDGFVGSPMAGVALEPIDPTAQASQVRVRSAAVGLGYFPNPDPEKLGGGIFVPDDLLSRSGPGYRATGRLSDVINVAGKKVHPAQIEEQLKKFPGVREAIVFGRISERRSEEVVACVVSAAETRSEELLEFCRQRLSPWQVPKQIFLVDQIPVTERGKVNRRELASQFAR